MVEAGGTDIQQTMFLDVGKKNSANLSTPGSSRVPRLWSGVLPNCNCVRVSVCVLGRVFYEFA